MRTLVKTFAAAALIAVSTFAMAAEGPGVYIGYSGPSLSLEYGPPVSVITGQQL